MTNAEVHLLKTGRDGGSINTDTMLIVHVPADGSKATLISFPRDSYVKIPGYGMNRLNAAYAFGYEHAQGSADAKRAAGANLLIKTISQLTGLTIDHFVQVSLLGFYRISNAIGGVPINLCHAVNDPRYSHLVLSAGKHSIKGVQALDFVRQRHGLRNGDFDRVARQRYFITAAFRKVTSAGVLLNPSKLHSLVSAVDRSIYVDSRFDLLKFAAQISSLSANDIVGKTIPFVRYADINGLGSVNIVNPAKVKSFVHNLINGANSNAPAAKDAPTTGQATPAQPSTAVSTAASPAKRKPIDAGCIN